MANKIKAHIKTRKQYRIKQTEQIISTTPLFFWVPGNQISGNQINGDQLYLWKQVISTLSLQEPIELVYKQYTHTAPPPHPPPPAAPRNHLEMSQVNSKNLAAREVSKASLEKSKQAYLRIRLPKVKHVRIRNYQSISLIVEEQEEMICNNDFL